MHVQKEGGGGGTGGGERRVGMSQRFEAVITLGQTQVHPSRSSRNGQHTS